MKAIYGLFDGTGKCRYVGLTDSPKQRKADHADKGLAFRTLRFCEKSDGSRLEGQVIRAYKRKGQCDLNEAVNLPPVSPKVTTLEQMRNVWRKAGQRGGRNRAMQLTASRRSEIARLGALARIRN